MLAGIPGVDASPLPTKVGQEFLIDDWDYVVTENDLGFNYFSGNTGATESVEGTTDISLSAKSNGSTGGSLRLAFDFTGQDQEVFAGYFASLFGLTDTLVSLDGSGVEPTETTPFPGYFLDTQNIFADVQPFAGRDVESIAFDVRLLSDQPVTVKIELQDEAGSDVFTRRTLTSDDWQTVSLSIPASFNDSVSDNGSTAGFNWNQVSVFSLIVERANIGDGVHNPDTGAFLVDNLKLVDADGEYPDLSAVKLNDGGSLSPLNEAAFLDLVRARSFQYFLDFASTDPRTGGMIQDRSTFADLMSIGGVGFQLTAYVIGAERGYFTRAEAAMGVHDVLTTLHDQPQGPERVGTLGHEGFFYHFAGIDGLRKQNFDFAATPDLDESLNTVELSTIDTSLAIAGVVTATQYFSAGTPVEQNIRALADAIYGRVNWNFMVYTNPSDPDDPQNNQFYLGWKPNEVRDDSGPFGRFLIDDAAGVGQYSSKLENGVERPATLDFYTDEALLIAVLAMGSPNPAHRLGREVWDAIAREGDPFVKTFPGSLFTYQFASVWLDTDKLGTDNHPTRPTDFFENTQAAIDATRQYAIDNPNDRATWRDGRGEFLWGLSAAEGPFDDYFAHGASAAALAADGGLVLGPTGTLEAEDGIGGSTMPRGNASGGQTRQLDAGEALMLDFDAEVDGQYVLSVRYSNDNFGSLEQVTVTVDGIEVGTFDAQDTGDFGAGWNMFEVSPRSGPVSLGAGSHDVVVSVAGGDGFGVEIDQVTVLLVRPLETGTVTNYGVASSIVHRPAEAIRGLWEAAGLDLNGDMAADLLHPRFGFADAYNFDIADARTPGVGAAPVPGKEVFGPWANFAGFAIDHGPMLALIDNYLNDQFVPRLFMSHDSISAALDTLFPEIPQTVDIKAADGKQVNVGSNGLIQVVVFSTADFDATQVDRAGVTFAGAIARKSRLSDVNHDGRIDLVVQFRIQDTNMLDLYADALVLDLLDGTLDSAIQPISVKLSGTTSLGDAFEGLETLDLYLPKKSLAELIDSLT